MKVTLLAVLTLLAVDAVTSLPYKESITIKQNRAKKKEAARVAFLKRLSGEMQTGVSWGAQSRRKRRYRAVKTEGWVEDGLESWTKGDGQLSHARTDITTSPIEHHQPSSGVTGGSSSTSQSISLPSRLKSFDGRGANQLTPDEKSLRSKYFHQEMISRGMDQLSPQELERVSRNLVIPGFTKLSFDHQIFFFLKKIKKSVNYMETFQILRQKWATSKNLAKRNLQTQYRRIAIKGGPRKVPTKQEVEEMAERIFDKSRGPTKLIKRPGKSHEERQEVYESAVRGLKALDMFTFKSIADLEKKSRDVAVDGANKSVTTHFLLRHLVETKKISEDDAQLFRDLRHMWKRGTTRGE